MVMLVIVEKWSPKAPHPACLQTWPHSPSLGTGPVASFCGDRDSGWVSGEWWWGLVAGSRVSVLGPGAWGSNLWLGRLMPAAKEISLLLGRAAAERWGVPSEDGFLPQRVWGITTGQ